MKKITVALLVLMSAFFAVAAFTACQSPPPPPPPVEEQPEPEPPPPEPIPEPEPEPEVILPPSMDVVISPQPFSPDGDGIDDELVISVTVRSHAPVTGWSVVIREPVAPNSPFFELEGEGPIPSRITWDGIGSAGELVQSAMDYPVTITIVTADGETVVFDGEIVVDVLVRREDGGVLRVIVPSIIFGPNVGDFTGIAPEVMENNQRVLRRIAEILNRFAEYSITVEGHANPTFAPNHPLRGEEETGSARMLGLQPLSERRAATVLEVLVGLGVNRARLSSVGMGGTRVVVEYGNRDYWWQNRRVEFILVR